MTKRDFPFPRHDPRRLNTRLNAFICFPESRADQDLFELVCDYQDNRIGPEKKPPEIVSFLNTRFAKFAGQRSIAGLVAQAMCIQKLRGVRPSINGAAQLVSRLAYKSGGLYRVDHVDGISRHNPVNLVGDVPTIRNYFRKFACISHIVAASIWTEDTDDGAAARDSVPDHKTIEFLRVAQTVQRVIQEHQSGSQWNLWDVVVPCPPEYMRPPVELSLSELEYAFHISGSSD